MKIIVILILIALAASLIAITSVLHGSVDFTTPPTFEYDFGSYNAVMFFKTQTVLSIHGGTWFIISVPFYVLALGVVAVPSCLWYLLKRRKHETMA
jgi:hypothetical protein